MRLDVRPPWQVRRTSCYVLRAKHLARAHKFARAGGDGGAGRFLSPHWSTQTMDAELHTSLDARTVIATYFDGDTQSAERAALHIARTHARRAWPDWVATLCPHVSDGWRHPGTSCTARGYEL
jgi:hypothetical protein